MVALFYADDHSIQTSKTFQLDKGESPIITWADRRGPKCPNSIGSLLQTTLKQAPSYVPGSGRVVFAGGKHLNSLNSLKLGKYEPSDYTKLSYRSKPLSSQEYIDLITDSLEQYYDPSAAANVTSAMGAYNPLADDFVDPLENSSEATELEANYVPPGYLPPWMISSDNTFSIFLSMDALSEDEITRVTESMEDVADDMLKKGGSQFATAESVISIASTELPNAGFDLRTAPAVGLFSSSTTDFTLVPKVSQIFGGYGYPSTKPAPSTRVEYRKNGQDYSFFNQTVLRITRHSDGVYEFQKDAETPLNQTITNSDYLLYENTKGFSVESFLTLGCRKSTDSRKGNMCFQGALNTLLIYNRPLAPQELKNVTMTLMGERIGPLIPAVCPRLKGVDTDTVKYLLSPGLAGDDFSEGAAFHFTCRRSDLEWPKDVPTSTRCGSDGTWSNFNVAPSEELKNASSQQQQNPYYYHDLPVCAPIAEHLSCKVDQWTEVLPSTMTLGAKVKDVATWQFDEIDLQSLTTAQKNAFTTDDLSNPYFPEQAVIPRVFGGALGYFRCASGSRLNGTITTTECDSSTGLFIYPDNTPYPTCISTCILPQDIRAGQRQGLAISSAWTGVDIEKGENVTFTCTDDSQFYPETNVNQMAVCYISSSTGNGSFVPDVDTFKCRFNCAVSFPTQEYNDLGKMYVRGEFLKTLPEEAYLSTAQTIAYDTLTHFYCKDSSYDIVVDNERITYDIVPTWPDYCSDDGQFNSSLPVCAPPCIDDLGPIATYTASGDAVPFTCDDIFSTFNAKSGSSDNTDACASKILDTLPLMPDFPSSDKSSTFAASPLQNYTVSSLCRKSCDVCLPLMTSLPWMSADEFACLTGDTRRCFVDGSTTTSILVFEALKATGYQLGADQLDAIRKAVASLVTSFPYNEMAVSGLSGLMDAMDQLDDSGLYILDHACHIMRDADACALLSDIRLAANTTEVATFQDCKKNQSRAACDTSLQMGIAVSNATVAIANSCALGDNLACKQLAELLSELPAAYRQLEADANLLSNAAAVTVISSANTEIANAVQAAVTLCSSGTFTTRDTVTPAACALFTSMDDNGFNDIYIEEQVALAILIAGGYSSDEVLSVASNITDPTLKQVYNDAATKLYTALTGKAPSTSSSGALQTNEKSLMQPFQSLVRILIDLLNAKGDGSNIENAYADMGVLELDCTQNNNTASCTILGRIPTLVLSVAARIEDLCATQDDVDACRNIYRLTPYDLAAIAVLSSACSDAYPDACGIINTLKTTLADAYNDLSSKCAANDENACYQLKLLKAAVAVAITMISPEELASLKRLIPGLFDGDTPELQDFELAQAWCENEIATLAVNLKKDVCSITTIFEANTTTIVNLHLSNYPEFTVEFWGLPVNSICASTCGIDGLISKAGSGLRAEDVAGLANFCAEIELAPLQVQEDACSGEHTVQEIADLYNIPLDVLGITDDSLKTMNSAYGCMGTCGTDIGLKLTDLDYASELLANVPCVDDFRISTLCTQIVETNSSVCQSLDTFKSIQSRDVYSSIDFTSLGLTSAIAELQVTVQCRASCLICDPSTCGNNANITSECEGMSLTFRALACPADAGVVVKDFIPAATLVNRNIREMAAVPVSDACASTCGQCSLSWPFTDISNSTVCVDDETVVGDACSVLDLLSESDAITACSAGATFEEIAVLAQLTSSDTSIIPSIYKLNVNTNCKRTCNICVATPSNCLSKFTTACAELDDLAVVARSMLCEPGQTLSSAMSSCPAVSALTSDDQKTEVQVGCMRECSTCPIPRTLDLSSVASLNPYADFAKIFSSNCTDLIGTDLCAPVILKQGLERNAVCTNTKASSLNGVASDSLFADRPVSEVCEMSCGVCIPSGGFSSLEISNAFCTSYEVDACDQIVTADAVHKAVLCASNVTTTDTQTYLAGLGIGSKAVESALAIVPNFENFIEMCPQTCSRCAPSIDDYSGAQKLKAKYELNCEDDERLSNVCSFLNYLGFYATVPCGPGVKFRELPKLMLSFVGGIPQSLLDASVREMCRDTCMACSEGNDGWPRNQFCEDHPKLPDTCEDIGKLAAMENVERDGGLPEMLALTPIEQHDEICSGKYTLYDTHILFGIKSSKSSAFTFANSPVKSLCRAACMSCGSLDNVEMEMNVTNSMVLQATLPATLSRADKYVDALTDRINGVDIESNSTSAAASVSDRSSIVSAASPAEKASTIVITSDDDTCSDMDITCKKIPNAMRSTFCDGRTWLEAASAWTLNHFGVPTSLREQTVQDVCAFTCGCTGGTVDAESRKAAQKRIQILLSEANDGVPATIEDSVLTDDEVMQLLSNTDSTDPSLTSNTTSNTTAV